MKGKMPRRSQEQISVTIKVTRAQQIAYDRAAANGGGMSRQAWCKAMLDAAAGISAAPEQLKAATRAAKRARKSA